MFPDTVKTINVVLTCIPSIGSFAKYESRAIYRGPSEGIWGRGELLQLWARKCRASQRLENAEVLVLWMMSHEDGEEMGCLVWVILVPEAFIT